MKKIVPVSRLSDDELLGAIDTSDGREKLLEQVNDIGFFLSHYNVKKGNYLVGIPLLYRLYKTWSKKPVSHLAFKSELSNYVLIYKSKYVHISIKALNITQATYEYLLKKEEIKPSNLDTKFIADFVDHYKIDEGTCWIDVMVMYKAASFYARLKKTRLLAMKPGRFANYLKLYLPYKFTDKHMFRVSAVAERTLLDELARRKVIDAAAKEKNSKVKVKVSRSRSSS